jgi:hypothetical protein
MDKIKFRFPAFILLTFVLEASMQASYVLRRVVRIDLKRIEKRLMQSSERLQDTVCADLLIGLAECL